MKAMCFPGFHHNGFVATHALGNVMYPTVHYVPNCMSCHKAIAVITERAHCSHYCIYIAPVSLL